MALQGDIKSIELNWIVLLCDLWLPGTDRPLIKRLFVSLSALAPPINKNSASLENATWRGQHGGDNKEDKAARWRQHNEDGWATRRRQHGGVSNKDWSTKWRQQVMADTKSTSVFLRSSWESAVLSNPPTAQDPISSESEPERYPPHSLNWLMHYIAIKKRFQVRGFCLSLHFGSFFKFFCIIFYLRG